MKKKLPRYLENSLINMANHSGENPKEAYEHYRKQLISESLTAKANPGKRNPAKLERCVKKVKAKKQKVNAYAVCTAALKNPKKRFVLDYNKFQQVIETLPEKDLENKEKILKLLRSAGLYNEAKMLDNIDESDIKKFLNRMPGKAKWGLSNPRASEGRKPEEFNQEELAKGTKHEMEHTDDKEEAQRIAMDHLVETPDYYTKLENSKIETSSGEDKMNKLAGEVTTQISHEDKEELEKLSDEKIKELEKEVLPQENPTQKKFIEIERVFWNEFLQSPLGMSLDGAPQLIRDAAGKIQKKGVDKMGRKFGQTRGGGDIKMSSLQRSKQKEVFDMMRNFSVDLAESILSSKEFKRRIKRTEHPATKSYTPSSAEYRKRPKPVLLTKEERKEWKEQNIKETISVQSYRYSRLLLSSIIFGMLRELFYLNHKMLDDVLNRTVLPSFEYPQYMKIEDLNSKYVRTAYVKKIVDLMHTRFMQPLSDKSLNDPVTNKALDIANYLEVESLTERGVLSERFKIPTPLKSTAGDEADVGSEWEQMLGAIGKSFKPKS